jgi:hypothetical protein
VKARARSRAGSAASGAASAFAKFDFLLHASSGLLELDFEVVAEVGTASGFAATTRAAAEEMFENPSASARPTAGSAVVRMAALWAGAIGVAGGMYGVAALRCVGVVRTPLYSGTDDRAGGFI